MRQNIIESREETQRFGIHMFKFEPYHHDFLAVQSWIYFWTSMSLHFTICKMEIIVPFNIKQIMNVGHRSLWHMVGIHKGQFNYPFQTVRTKKILFGNIGVQWSYLPNEKLGHSLSSMSAFMATAEQNIWNWKCRCKTLMGVYHAVRNGDIWRASECILFLKEFYLTKFGVFT